MSHSPFTTSIKREGYFRLYISYPHPSLTRSLSVTISSPLSQCRPTSIVSTTHLLHLQHCSLQCRLHHLPLLTESPSNFYATVLPPKPRFCNLGFRRRVIQSPTTQSPTTQSPCYCGLMAMSEDPVREWILSEGKASDIKRISSIGSGYIILANNYDTGIDSFFVKTNRSIGPAMFEGEALRFRLNLTGLAIVNIYVHLARGDKHSIFPAAISKDGRSFNDQLFGAATDVLRRIGEDMRIIQEFM